MLTQCVDLRRDEPEIFGDERQSAELLLEHVEQIGLRSIDPASMYGGRLVGGNLPVLLESAEVIEADDVAGVKRPPHAVDPPVVTLRPQFVPAIERVSPTLASGRKGVGRNSGNDFGLEILAELEDVRVRPNIGAVVADEDR